MNYLKKDGFGAVFKNIGILFLVLIITLVGLTTYTFRKSFPQENGTIAIRGLENQVKVLRDEWGIPQIYATSSHDLFLAQGYVHAQDRFWQMDFWRHIGAGRLSEMFGESQLDKDKFLRTMGWKHIAQQEFATLNAETKANLQAYAEGVNIYLASHQGSALSLEYAVLKLIHRQYRPEPWQPIDSILWGKVMAYDLSTNLGDEIERSILLKDFSQQRVEELFPVYPDDFPVIVPEFKVAKKAEETKTKQNINLLALPDITPDLKSIASNVAAMEEILGGTRIGVGSNSWTISGKRTVTGKPILADDPHLAVQMPSIWYEVGLHCISTSNSISNNCPYNVTGFSFAGVPGVIVGHNHRIAWGVTNVMSDTMDLYVEKINPENPNQYEINGKWVDMQLVNEEIQVADSEPVNQIVRYTQHGAILSDVLPSLQKFPKSSVKVPTNYAVSLRWTVLEPSQLITAIQEINRAENWSQFRRAASKFDIAAQNLVYADVDGNIGYQMTGKTPIRKKGDGRYPVAGWNDEYEWIGYIDFEESPHSFNPSRGYIVTANNAIVDQSYPYVITKDWVHGYRAKRIEEMISDTNKLLTLADIESIQGDTLDINARDLIPIFKSIDFDDSQTENARQLLLNWDFQLKIESPASAIFETFWKKLLALTFHDELPLDYHPDGGDRWYAVVKNLMEQPDNLWWDNRNTPQVENRDEIFKQALVEAVAELENSLGHNPEKWTWGKLHQINFRNVTLGKSGVALIERLFNRGTFATAGDGETVNANRWKANQSSFEVTHIPSLRMIVDLASFDNSQAIHSTGQSGHAFNPHYTDMIEPWRDIKYHSMLWEDDKIDRNTKSALLLVPGE
ncbi:penicillin acylase family protein [Plectonema cf. radiosum LEGE 06105]|uniref:Penicillin acylase family protein n=1 Tax=Plectonema cf. radiosum LEGE 06105 TaxID=945769 RepID=A0A8J7F3M6_9CYAN|nr:penicillin acylase family protein [Plectonema radiosum]MBE9211704.1 penicillin acylase family protein [Plectonema cf. radiosum LEGE 06105]